MLVVNCTFFQPKADPPMAEIKQAPVAQWIEQKFPKLLVGGSTPLGGTKQN